MNKILCSVATKGRYFSTLPLVLNAILNQTKLPDKLVIFDDNDEPQDMRNEFLYQHFFRILDIKGIKWEWLFAGKKGQHHIHQTANTMGFDWVWRVDDDAIPEPNVLKNLSKDKGVSWEKMSDAPFHIVKKHPTKSGAYLAGAGAEWCW